MKDQPAPPTPQFFEVKVEATVPCTLSYRVWANSPDEALDKIKTQSPSQFTPKIQQKKISKATVYNAGTIMVRATRNYK